MSGLVVLERTLPSGVVKRHEPMPLKQAGQAVFYVLWDNRALDAPAATRAAATVQAAPLGTEVAAGGYKFRLTEHA